jgi:hypothetical protein
MNKEEFIEKRKWKYFWGQKFKEVGTFLLILTLSISSCYFVGKFGIDVLKIIEITNKEVPLEIMYFLVGLPMIVFGGVAIIFIILIFNGIFNEIKIWIKNNMEKAVKRAEEDFVKEGIKDE